MNDPTGPDGREIRADARDVRADARDVRADITDTELQDRGVRADVREDVVSHREGSVVGSIRLLKWLVIVLIVLSVGSLLRSFVNQESSDKAAKAAKTVQEAVNKVDSTATQSRDASLETLAELRHILSQIEENNAGEPKLDNQAVINALQAIARLEAFLCNGPCPPVDGG